MTSSKYFQLHKENYKIIQINFMNFKLHKENLWG